MKTQIELREYATKLRTKPIPLSEIIPILQKAADRLDEYENTIHDLVSESESSEEDYLKMKRMMSSPK